MGLSPFSAPATFSMMPYTELAHGVWYPKGGMYRVVESLTHLAHLAGVEFIFNSAVERIDTNSAHARGMCLPHGLHLDADVVNANADLPYVYQNLLPQDKMVAKLARKEFSCSVISFFWGVDRTYASLAPHTLFLADDYRENFESIHGELSLPANPSLYLHAPARLDPGMAPCGQDSLTAIVPVGHLREGGGQAGSEQGDGKDTVHGWLLVTGKRGGSPARARPSTPPPGGRDPGCWCRVTEPRRPSCSS